MRTGGSPLPFVSALSLPSVPGPLPLFAGLLTSPIRLQILWDQPITVGPGPANVFASIVGVLRRNGDLVNQVAPDVIEVVLSAALSTALPPGAYYFATPPTIFGDPTGVPAPPFNAFPIT